MVELSFQMNFQTEPLSRVAANMGPTNEHFSPVFLAKIPAVLWTANEKGEVRNRLHILPRPICHSAWSCCR